MKTSAILTIIGLVMTSGSAAALWAHQHGERPILANKANISTIKLVSSINQNIRDLDKRCDSLRMTIERKRSDLLRVELSPNQDLRILELKSRLKNEIEDYQRLLEQQQERLRDKEIKESALIMQLSSA